MKKPPNLVETEDENRLSRLIKNLKTLIDRKEKKWRKN